MTGLIKYFVTLSVCIFHLIEYKPQILYSHCRYYKHHSTLVEFAEVAASGGTGRVSGEPFADVQQVTAVRAASTPDVETSDDEVAEGTRVGDGLARIAEPSAPLQRPAAQVAVRRVDVKPELDALALRQFDDESGRVPQPAAAQGVDVGENPVLDGRLVEQVTDPLAQHQNERNGRLDVAVLRHVVEHFDGVRDATPARRPDVAARAGKT